MAELQRRLLTRPDAFPPGSWPRRPARLLRAVPRREDWPSAVNSLLVEVSAPAEGTVVLRYSWMDGVPYFELPLEKLRSEGSDALWSCLLAVPKEIEEVFFRLAISVGKEGTVLDDRGACFRARF